MDFGLKGVRSTVVSVKTAANNCRAAGNSVKRICERPMLPSRTLPEARCLLVVSPDIACEAIPRNR